jgi:predicted MPP superfamily phosphohydrolase
MHLIGTAAAGGLYAMAVEPQWLEVVRRPLAVSGLPDALAGRTLVQMSDIHVGPLIEDAYVLDVFARVAALDPDIVVLTGDFVSHFQEVEQRVEAVYQQIPHGRRATVGVLGTHDYGPGWCHPDIADRVVEILTANGVSMLRNQVHDIAGLQIVGLDDLWGHRFHPGLAFADYDPGHAAIALSHNPDTVDLPGWEKFQGWILSGHTHGGQCKPPFLPPPVLPVRNRRYTCGEFGLSGNRSLYISRGVGHTVPVRFNVLTEVTLFELQSE